MNIAKGRSAKCRYSGQNFRPGTLFTTKRLTLTAIFSKADKRFSGRNSVANPVNSIEQAAWHILSKAPSSNVLGRYSEYLSSKDPIRINEASTSHVNRQFVREVTTQGGRRSIFNVIFSRRLSSRISLSALSFRDSFSRLLFEAPFRSCFFDVPLSRRTLRRVPRKTPKEKPFRKEKMIFAIFIVNNDARH